ncbi:MAG: sigma-70 family RNA polymerase sigma factor [Candidatus Aminicenantales bacterium]
MTDQNPIAEKTDEELAREARAGSRRSFEELACRYKRRLFVYLRPRLGSDEDAEDMVQDTFLKIYRSIDRYDPAYRFSTWLYTSASRLAIDSFRKAALSRDKSAALSGRDIPDPAAGYEVEAGATGVWDAARTLGADRYRVLWLRYGEDMTVEEIAAVLGRSRLAVRVLLHRARTSLVGRLGPNAGCPVRTRSGAARQAAGD